MHSSLNKREAELDLKEKKYVEKIKDLFEIQKGMDKREIELRNKE